MIKLRHHTLIAIAGAIWLGIGCMLLSMGLNFLVASILQENEALSHPLVSSLFSLAGGADQAVVILIALALGIGFLKGRTIFAKTVQRSVTRILSLPNPTSLSNLYEKKYYFLLGGMIGLGFLARLTPLDVRGFIDTAVGSALIQGAIHYIREAITVYRQPVPVRVRIDE